MLGCGVYQGSHSITLMSRDPENAEIGSSHPTACIHLQVGLFGGSLASCARVDPSTRSRAARHMELCFAGTEEIMLDVCRCDAQTFSPLCRISSSRAQPVDTPSLELFISSSVPSSSFRLLELFFRLRLRSSIVLCEKSSFVLASTLPKALPENSSTY